MGRNSERSKEEPLTKAEWKVIEEKINHIFLKIEKRLDKLEQRIEKLKTC